MLSLKEIARKEAAPQAPPLPALPATATQQPLNLTGLQLCVETHTGPEFGNMILAFVKDAEGKKYDLLYNSEGEPVHPAIEQGEAAATIEALSNFFCKQFRPGLYEGLSCLINEVA